MKSDDSISYIHRIHLWSIGEIKISNIRPNPFYKQWFIQVKIQYKLIRK